MDRRDAMMMNPPDIEGFDEATMEWTITTVDEQDDGSMLERSIVFPAAFAVCSTCRGKGTHVNPSIDAHGITREEFDDDPGFREDYFSGVYDVQCYECHGQRVVPFIITENLNEEQRRALEYIEMERKLDAEYDELSRLERIMGA